jgi:hypothetical protein
MLEKPCEGPPVARRRAPLLLFHSVARARPRHSTGGRLPLIEGLVLIVAVAVSFILAPRPELVTLATNVLILAMLAISFAGNSKAARRSARIT